METQRQSDEALPTEMRSRRYLLREAWRAVLIGDVDRAQAAVDGARRNGLVAEERVRTRERYE